MNNGIILCLTVWVACSLLDICTACNSIPPAEQERYKQRDWERRQVEWDYKAKQLEAERQHKEDMEKIQRDKEKYQAEQRLAEMTREVERELHEQKIADLKREEEQKRLEHERQTDLDQKKHDKEMLVIKVANEQRQREYELNKKKAEIYTKELGVYQQALTTVLSDCSSDASGCLELLDKIESLHPRNRKFLQETTYHVEYESGNDGESKNEGKSKNAKDSQFKEEL